MLHKKDGAENGNYFRDNIEITTGAGLKQSFSLFNSCPDLLQLDLQDFSFSCPFYLISFWIWEVLHDYNYYKVYSKSHVRARAQMWIM